VPRLRHVLAFGALAAMCGCGWFVDLGGLSEDAVPDASTTTDGEPPRDVYAPPDTATYDGGLDAAEANPYRDAVLADGPLSYWPFDDEKGTLVAVDVVGGKNAVVNGNATFGVPAMVGTGVSIDDLQSFLEVGDAYDFPGKAPYTIEAWIKPALGPLFLNVAVKRDPDGYGWVLYARREGTVTFEHRWAADQRVGYSETPRAYAQPAHLVVTFDGAKLAMYLDNQKLLKTFQEASGPGAGDNANVLTLGNGWAGVLDEIAIYGKALPPERITAHYKAAGR
jgi:trimeric autotransporter adhesin